MPKKDKSAKAEEMKQAAHVENQNKEHNSKKVALGPNTKR